MQLAFNDAEEFEVALRDIAQAWPALKPPNHVRISEGAAAVLRVSRPGNSPIFWSAAETPYMVEPLNTLASRVHSAVCFVGPAQTGKTMALGEAWMAHNVVNDPGDMLIVQMTQDKAREYSKQRIDRAIKNSPDLQAMLGRAQDDNTHDKLFRNGMWLRIAWPTATNLSSTSYRYVFGTDYDRWADNIDGEGDGFTLMGKRTTTYLSRGMVAVESSPGRLLKDPHWKPATPHEGPPVGGICGIYNRGDRRRQYWQCPHCNEFLRVDPGLGLFGLPDTRQLLEDIRTIDIGRMASQYARLVCPTNGCIITQDLKYDMNQAGVWLAEGLTIDGARRISGDARQSSIASFWLGGIAAAYVTWDTLIMKFLQALLEYRMNGSELPLQTTINTDQCLPYISRALIEQASETPLHERVDSTVERYVVPDDTRFVLASVDVQGGRNARFVVEVHAHGDNGKETVVDRYEIRRSNRPGVGEDEFAPLDPASYPEDWDILTEKVVKATYRTSNPDISVPVLRTIVDTGGEDGVTDKAYAWKRRLRQKGLSAKVVLSKGDPKLKGFMFRETWVGSKVGRGDIPLMLLNPNALKDIVDGCIRRNDANGPHYVFPAWLNRAYFDELEGEVRLPDGTWKKVKRNESFDLCYMQKALLFILGADKIVDWNDPPAWALPVLHGNPEAIHAAKPVTPRQALVAAAAQEEPQVEERRVIMSSYL